MLLLILGFFTVTCATFGESSLDEKLQAVLDKGVKKFNERGVSAAIVFSDDSVWMGTSGVSHDTVSMKPDMLFGIGSITKNFVAALTLKLTEEGTLSPDDQLLKWLPDYPHIDPEITIRQLLNHTSGIYMLWNNDDLWEAMNEDRTKVWTPEEVLEYIKEPHFLPGESWGYSNTNYLLMAMIIEKATGETLGALLKKHLWEPLNLQHYYLWLEDSIPENQAHIFGDDFQFGSSKTDLTFEPRASHESITFGSSGIVTTALDLAKWSQALYEGKLLSEKSMQEMLDFVEFDPLYNMSAYGLGVQLFTSNIAPGTKALGHGGASIGSATYMIYLPEYHASVVVMVNAFPTSSVDYYAKNLIQELISTSN